MRRLKICHALPAAVVFVASCASKPSAGPTPATTPTPPPAAELAKSGLDVARSADVVLKDSSRNREIPVRAPTPRVSGRFQ